MMSHDIQSLKAEFSAIQALNPKKNAKHVYPVALKTSAVKLFGSQKELTSSEFASVLGVSASTIMYWLKAYAEKGPPAPKMIPLSIKPASAQESGKVAVPAIGEAPSVVVIVIAPSGRSGAPIDYSKIVHLAQKMGA